MPPALSNPSSPLAHLDTLYPLACMLVGPEAAPALLQRVAEETAEKPPSERPSNASGWVAALLHIHEADASESRKTSDQLSSPSDPLREEAAQRVVREALPTALASCSPQERALIALDVLGTSEASPTEAVPARISSDRTPSDAWTTLRAQLTALLSDPESTLVDDALDDTFLRNATEELLVERYGSVPDPLRTRLQAILETTRPPSGASSSEEAESSLLDRLPPRPTPHGLLFTLLMAAMVLGGGIAVSYVLPSAPSSPSSLSLTAFSVQHRGAVTPEFDTGSRVEAKAYVDSVWNRAVTIPSVDGAPLRRVGRLPRDRGEDIPVLLYGDRDAPITAFAYNYALVRQIGDDVSLSANVRTALAESNAFVSGAEVSDSALLWRHRDDIYVAVAPTLSPDSLRQRLRLPD